MVFLLFNQSGYFINKKKEVQKNSKAIENREKSIVVLPFLNLSQNNSQNYLAEGITDAINVALSKKDSVRVISRTAAMTYKDESKLLSDIAKELEVDYLLEGSVLWDVDSVQIMLQLIKSLPREKHIWSRSYKEKQEIMGNDSVAINFNFAGNAEQSFRVWLSQAKSKSLSYTSNPTVLAQVHMFLNENEEGLAWLEKGYEIHEDDLPLMLQRPNFHNLHKEHRFKELVLKMGIVLNK